MKKIIPFVVGGIVLLLVVVFFVAKGTKGGGATPTPEDANVPDLPQAEWPVVSLTPTSNPTVPGSLGHWLDFKVQNLNVQGAASMDYELIYSTSDGGQQGVPGTVNLTGTDIDRPLLLGSESSGKFRYDAGVEQGTMTLKFRDSSGKLIGKLSTDFHLQTGVTALTSIDGNFTYNLSAIAKNVYFVTMKTFAAPAASMVVISQNGYSIFASDGKPHTGKLAQ
jgi:hypothetical protein